MLIFTADEEIGCGGARRMLEQPIELDKVGAIVVGEPTANYPLIGHKGIIWAQVETFGVSAHASMPEQGENAISKMARVINDLDRDGLNMPAHPILGKCTHNVGTIKAGSNANLIPNHATIEVDIRTVPGSTNDDALRALQHIVGDEAKVTPTINLESIISDHQDEWVQSCFSIMTPYLGERPEPKGATYATDGSVLKSMLGNPPTIILGPGEPSMAHKTDEFCSMQKLQTSVEIYSEIANSWCL